MLDAEMKALAEKCQATAARGSRYRDAEILGSRQDVVRYNPIFVVWVISVDEGTGWCGFRNLTEYIVPASIVVVSA